MREYFEINGYWKDDKSEFEGLIVTNFNDLDELGVYSEDDIFLFGYSENDLEELKDESSQDDFVVTSYTRIIQ